MTRTIFSAFFIAPLLHNGPNSPTFTLRLQRGLRHEDYRVAMLLTSIRNICVCYLAARSLKTTKANASCFFYYRHLIPCVFTGSGKTSVYPQSGGTRTVCPAKQFRFIFRVIGWILNVTCVPAEQFRVIFRDRFFVHSVLDVDLVRSVTVGLVPVSSHN